MSLSLRSAHQLGIHHQVISPDHLHRGNNAQTEQVVLKNLYVHMHITTVNKKRGYEFKRARRGVWEVLEGGKGEM